MDDEHSYNPSDDIISKAHGPLVTLPLERKSRNKGYWGKRVCRRCLQEFNGMPKRYCEDCREIVDQEIRKKRYLHKKQKNAQRAS